MNLSNLRREHVKNATWPKEKKFQCVVNYLATGNLKIVSSLTGVEYGLIRQWKMQPWWKEFENEIRATENLELDTKLTKLVDRSLDVTMDRLENGEFVYDQKTGQMKRKPVGMKDAAKVSVDLLTKRELLRGNATSRTEGTQISMADQLKALATEFARMTGAKVPETIEADVTDVTPRMEDEEDAVHDEREEGLQEGSGEVHVEAFGSEEEDGAERSTSSDGEGREGT